MLLHQYKKLYELRDKYIDDYNAMKTDGADNFEILETLMVLDADRAITEKINDIGDIFGDKPAIKMIVCVIARSYGQLMHLYATKFGDATELRILFETQLRKVLESYGRK